MMASLTVDIKRRFSYQEENSSQFILMVTYHEPSDDFSEKHLLDDIRYGKLPAEFDYITV